MLVVTAVISVVAVVMPPPLVPVTTVTFVILTTPVPFSVISFSSDANLDHETRSVGATKVRIVAKHRLKREQKREECEESCNKRFFH